LSNIQALCEPCNNKERAAYIATCYAKRAAVCNSKKQTESESKQLTETEKKRLIKKAPWTTQLKIEYRHITLVYLLEHVKDGKHFNIAVADVEALASCSHDKAIEYLDAFSNSAFAPYAKRTLDKEQNEIDPIIEPRRHWDAAKYATEEYKKALQVVNDKQAAQQYPKPDPVKGEVNP
jgi:hypothetical protein